MNKNFWTLGLLGLAAYLLWKHYSAKDDLQVHMEEEARLKDIGEGVVQIDTAANNTYPLTTIGDTPLAGIEFDPFNPTSPASNPKPIELYPGVLSF